MPSTNRAIISAAGGGKTTRIVRDALECSDERSILLTYTDNNIGESKKRFYELNSSIPDHVEISSWYTFLLREMARPYQNTLFDGRIAGIFWVEGRSETFADATKIDRYYFHGSRRIYSDKLARFVCECDKASSGAVIKRLEQRFERLCIDEIQDMAGWDIEIIELLLKSRSALHWWAIIARQHSERIMRRRIAAMAVSISSRSFANGIKLSFVV